MFVPLTERLSPQFTEILRQRDDDASEKYGIVAFGDQKQGLRIGPRGQRRANFGDSLRRRYSERCYIDHRDDPSSTKSEENAVESVVSLEKAICRETMILWNLHILKYIYHNPLIFSCSAQS
jgi:hypothetical protein